MKFTRDDVAPMAVGAAVLGAGGAGDAHVTEVMLAEIVEARGPIEIADPASLPSGVPLLPIGLMGSPLAVSELLLSLPQLDALLAGSTALQGAPAAICPLEMAGINALVPLIAAARFGLPCLDADLIGRGVPTLDMTVFQLAGGYPGTQLLADPVGRTITVQADAEFSPERLLRPLVETMGSLAGYTMLPYGSDDLAERALGGTLGRCLSLGRAFLGLPGMPAAEADRVLAELGGSRIAEGAVVERLSHPDELGPRSSVIVEAGGDGALTRVELRNEFHVVTRDGEILATVPDLIVLVDRDTWAPLTVEQIGLGQEVVVLAIPAHPRWRTEQGIAVMGPRAFGHGTDFVPFDRAEATA